MHFVLKTLLVLSLICNATYCYAQEVQADSASSENEDPSYLVANIDSDSTQKFYFRTSLDGMMSTGNIERTLVQFSNNIDWKPSRLLKISSSPSYIYGQQAGLLNEREFFGDIRISAFYNRPLYGLALTSWERSNLRQINNRWIQGIGLGYKILRKKRSFLSISNLIMHESTDFNAKTDINLWRNSTRVLGEFALSAKLSLLGIFIYQPSISTKGNIRTNGSLTMKYDVGNGINFQVKYDNIYESYVLVGRKNTDTRLTLGLSYQY